MLTDVDGAPSPDIDRATVARVCAAWREMASADVSRHGSCIVPRRSDRGISPPGWVGIVAIDDDVIVSAPPEMLPRLRQQLRSVLTSALTEPEQLNDILGPLGQMRGPAVLLFADRVSLPERSDIEMGPIDDAALATLLAECTNAEVAESGISTADGVIAAYRDGDVAGVAKYEVWPGDLAHIGVLTAPDFRGQRIAASVAGAVAQRALTQGLIPQWRAAVANDASLRAGLRLGFVQIGRQLSVEI